MEVAGVNRQKYKHFLQDFLDKKNDNNKNTKEIRRKKHIFIYLNVIS